MAMNYPAEGRNYLADVAVRNGTKIGNWYILLYEGDYTPQDTDTAANIVGRATEVTAYEEGMRPELITAAPVGGALNNQGAIAQVKLTANKTIRGFAVVSSAGKGTSTGKLLALQKLAEPKAYNAGDIVKIPVSLLITNAA